MATTRRVRRKNLVNSVSDMQRRISYVEKLPNKRVIANGGVTAGKIGTAAITRGNVTFGVVKPVSEKPAIGAAVPENYDNIYYNSGTGALTGIDQSGDEFQFADPVAQASASDALTSAGSRNRIFFQTTAPTNPINTYNLVAGDTWFDTDADYKLSKWTGSAWTDAPLGDAAFANISVTKLIAGNITAGQYIQAGLNNNARIILAPDSGTSGGYSWDAGLSIYSGASTKSFYADMSGNLTITGGTIQTTSSTTSNRIVMNSSSLNLYTYNSGDIPMITLDASNGVAEFSDRAIATGRAFESSSDIQSKYSGFVFPPIDPITGSALKIGSAQTNTYDRSDLLGFLTSDFGGILPVIQKTPVGTALQVGSGAFGSELRLNGPRPTFGTDTPTLIISNNLEWYGGRSADNDDTGAGQGWAKRSVHIRGPVGTHFTDPTTSAVYAVKTTRNIYVVPSSVGDAGFSTRDETYYGIDSYGVFNGEVLLKYTP